MKDVAILIMTFLRDDALFACVRSVRKHYPDIAIFIADTGHESKRKSDFCIDHKCTLFNAGFDAGVCVMKNEGLERIPDKFRYVLVCEDDIVFTAETKLETLKEILERRDRIGIAGCLIKRVKREGTTDQNYEARLSIARDTIYVRKVAKPQWKKLGDARFFYCDIISNVFMMRREIWREIKWDERYKTTPEHTDYFLLLKRNTDWRVAFTDSISMEHHAQYYGDHEYSAKRMRVDGYKKLGTKWGVKYYWNSWHKNWGITNPMGLYTYAKQRFPKEAEESTLSVQRRDSKIAIGIKTFMREGSLFKTLDSIERYFPYAYRLYIADDSGSMISDEKEYRYQQLEIQGHVVIRLPFNSGISAGRNEIIKRVKEEYVLIMDDDIRLTNSESIEKMKQVLDSSDDIGLCAGMIYQENGEYFGGHAYSRGIMLEINGGALFRHSSKGKLAKTNGILFNYADQVVNFFLAKRAVFKSVTWDSRIKIEYDHMDFFLNLKRTKWKATICLDTRLIHSQQLELDPIYIRHRRSAPVQYFYAKHGIGNIINKYQQEARG